MLMASLIFTGLVGVWVVLKAVRMAWALLWSMTGGL